MPRDKKRPPGQIRQSQVVTTFGPGSMVDLRDYAVLVGGLDHWTRPDRRIFEDRLTGKILEVIKVPEIKLYAPPVDSSDPEAPSTGITCWRFPEWFIVQKEEQGPEGSRARRLVHLRALDKGKYERTPVVPVRFVMACLNGHISDIEWYGFVHEFRGDCSGRQLWIEERGTSGDLAEVFVRCDCGVARSLARATRIADVPLGRCDGSRPWLGSYSKDRCGADEGGALPNRLLVRSASDAYFSQTLSVISIPDADASLRKAVNAVWEDFLQYCESEADVRKERRKGKVSSALEGLPDDAVFAEIKRRKGGVAASKKGIKQAEIETLLVSQDEVGDDSPEGDYYARTLPLAAKRSGLMSAIDRVVLVHRLREVIAQVGFTRFEASTPDVSGELRLDVRRAPLAAEVSWLPAVENRGEGVFLSFKKERVQEWLGRAGVKDRGRQLQAGFNAWKKLHTAAKADFPSLPYLFLHSLSHLLITAVSLECGYAASSIRERVYALDGGFGILLYTGTPDAEGTLGGLVQVGRQIERHLRNALELGRLCSNDPVCAQHSAENRQVERFLHGAACHGCLLIAETSCEKRNDFLDRALVVSTVGDADAAFFGEDDL